MPKVSSSDDSLRTTGPRLSVQQSIARALEFHRRGSLEEASGLYQAVLDVAPDHVDALHLLGVVNYQRSCYAEAERLIATALAGGLNSAEALARSNYGLALKALNRNEEALVSYDRALALKSDFVEAHYNRGNTLMDLKRPEEALASYDKALEINPHYVEAHNNRGNPLRDLGRPEEALASYDKALAINPNYAEAHYNRGNALLHLERPEAALASYDKALAINPNYAEAHNNRSSALIDLERPEEALASCDKALAINPNYAEAHYNRGNSLVNLKRPEEALASYDKTLALIPDYAEALNNRARALLKLKRPQEALASCDKALAIKPDFAAAHFMRGIVLHELSRNTDAVASYETALSFKADLLGARFAACMAEPRALYEHEDEIAERRAAYRERLRALCDIDDVTILRDLAKYVGTCQPFYLAYQGQNDRELQTAYGTLACRVMAARYPPAPLAQPPTADEPVRVGIVSGYFQSHSNWKVPIKGWLSQLDRRKFRLFGYYTNSQADAETRSASAMCERFVQGPHSIDQWRNEILADQPHVLIYPEIGMDPVAAPLAAQRLAPVQCNSWGHPDTSGFPTLDYFLSSDLMEPADGQDHYSERLVRLPNLSIYYEPPTVPPLTLSRDELGFRRGATVFWCAQSLYKFLPQFDPVFPGIARQVPDCQFAFIEFHGARHITDLFRKRLDRVFAAAGLQCAKHCVLLPRTRCRPIHSGYRASRHLPR